MGDDVDSSVAPRCWICMEDTNTPINPIVTGLCQCTRDAGYVHQNCIDEFVFSYSHAACVTCHTVYRKQSEGEVNSIDSMSFAKEAGMLLKYFVLPALIRTCVLLFWLCLSFVLVPLMVGSFFYNEALSPWGFKMDGDILPPPHPTTSSQSTSHHFAFLPLTLLLQWTSLWELFEPWLLGTIIGSIIRLVWKSWKSWKASLPHPGEILPAEEEENSRCPAPGLFDLLNRAEKLIGMKSIGWMTATHAVLGTILVVVLASREWLLILVGVVTVTAGWSATFPQRSFPNPTRQFDDLDAIKRSLTDWDIIQLFTVAATRFSALVCLSASNGFLLHVVLVPLLSVDGSVTDVVDHVSILRIFLYSAFGILNCVAISSIDCNFMCQLFARGVDLFTFHANQTTEEMQSRLADILFIRSYDTTPFSVLMRSVLFFIPVYLVSSVFFLAPLLVVAWSRHLLFGDAFESGKAIDGSVLQYLLPTVTAVQRQQLPIAQARPFSSRGVVQLPLQWGFYQSSPPKFASPMVLWDWLSHMYQHTGSHAVKQAVQGSGNNMTEHGEGVTMASLSPLFQAGGFCITLWEGCVAEVVDTMLRTVQGTNQIVAVTTTNTSTCSKSNDGVVVCESTSVTTSSLSPPLPGMNNTDPSVITDTASLVLTDLTSTATSLKKTNSSGDQDRGPESQTIAVADTGSAITFAPMLACEMGLMLSFRRVMTLEVLVDRLDAEWPKKVSRLTTAIYWRTADIFLRHPLMMHIFNNLVLLVGWVTALHCVASVPTYRLMLRQLYGVAKLAGDLTGMDAYLFSEEGRLHIEQFLAAGEETAEVVQENVPIELMFEPREDGMEADEIPDHLLLRRIAFMTLFYPCAVCIFCELPIASAFFFASVTTQVVPLVSLGVCFFFALLHPHFFWCDAVLSGILWVVTLVVLVVYVTIAYPISVMRSVNLTDTLKTSYGYAKQLRPKVIPLDTDCESEGK